MTQAQRDQNHTTHSEKSFPVLPLVIGLCALFTLYFLRMGSYPLFDPDEPIYAQVGREMANGAGWLSPHLNGALWFDKPPLFYWLSGLSIAIFGPTEFACRLPSALGAVGLVGLVYALARHDFGPRTALVCSLVMATCLQQIMLARAAVTDMTFVFFLTLALLCYRRWFDEATEATANTRAQWVWALSCGAATGLAMLTKGPVAPVLLSVTFFLHALWMKRLRLLRAPSALLAIVAVLVVGLPWYVAMYLLHGQEFVQGFLVANNVTRFLKAEHAEQTGHWYSIFFNVPILLTFFFPWSVFVPQALVRGWRMGQRPHSQALGSTVGTRLALTWFGVVFVFFSISKTLLITYTFPLYPAAALLVGALWHEAENEANVRRGVGRGLWAVLAVSVILTVALTLTARHKYPQAQLAFLVPGLIIFLACGVALWLSRRDKVAPAAWSLGAGMTILACWLICIVMPLIVPGESTRDLVEKLPTTAAQVGEFQTRVPSLPFYLHLRPQDRFAGSLERDAARRLLRQNTPVFIVAQQKNYQEISVVGAGEWTRSGKLVVIANAPALALR